LRVALDQYVSSQEINQEWARWCEKQVEVADHVLIVVTETYRRRFQREENPGVGYGASFEAKLIYDDLYATRGINSKYRVVLFDPSDEQSIPPALRGYDVFRVYHSHGNARLLEWLNPEPATAHASRVSPIAWPTAVAHDWDIADRREVTDIFARMLSGQAKNRVLLISSNSGSGKTRLMAELKDCARQAGVSCSLLDCKGCPSLDELFDTMFLALGKVLRNAPISEKREYAVIQDVQQLTSPVLLIFDSYETASADTQRWLETKLLLNLDDSPGLVVVIAGQKVPDIDRFTWSNRGQHITLSPIQDASHWHQYAVRKGIPVSLEELRILTKYSKGSPQLMQMLLPPSASRPLTEATGE
jgi:hypothetical protein